MQGEQSKNLIRVYARGAHTGPPRLHVYAREIVDGLLLEPRNDSGGQALHCTGRLRGAPALPLSREGVFSAPPARSRRVLFLMWGFLNGGSRLYLYRMFCAHRTCAARRARTPRAPLKPARGASSAIGLHRSLLPSQTSVVMARLVHVSLDQLP